MKHSARYTVMYAAVLGVVCAGVLGVANALTRTRSLENERAYRVESVLGVLGAPLPAHPSAQQVLDAYEKHVREETLASARKDEKVKVYVYRDKPDGPAAAYALPFEGPGLWGPIRGFLAFEPNLTRIRGIVFYQQEETPGLGGRIASADFCSRFENKSIKGPKGVMGLRIGKDAHGPNAVDAITGATLTSDAVERIIDRAITPFPLRTDERSGR